ncbi:MAG: CDP-diacylglycerol--glycerol-3-phosphate 3-phosphatidyltransferase [Bdellovibrionales bacterium]|nr:CDP-diacylglycerol--glycerol-3-phosphate 3-phosphatidyltransferase [Bdellovibrionales bacterium]
MSSVNTPLIRLIPNILTIARLILVPLFVLLMTIPSALFLDYAVVVFVIGVVTDYLDGIIARKFDAVTELGKLLDPLADKLLVLSALIMLVAQRSEVTGAPWVPGWMVVLIFAREFWVTGLRGIAASQGIIVAASSSGKLKSALQMMAIILLLLHGKADFRSGDFLFIGDRVGLNLLLTSIVISYWGAAEYSWKLYTGEHQSSMSE